MGILSRIKPAALLPFAVLSLFAGMWAGLQRMGWARPSWQIELPMSHGPLMVGGFLGTLIGVERAVALGRPWTMLAPLAAGVGGALLTFGIGGTLGPILITLGSFLLVCVFGLVLKRQLALFTVVTGAGAVLWLFGNVLWISGQPIFRVVFWWVGFLVVTIVGERIELNRVIQISPKANAFLIGFLLLFTAGLLVGLMNHALGIRVAGLALLLVAAWLLFFDIARRTVKKTGLTRYIAVCLLGGYLWLAVGGALALYYGNIVAGFQYDAVIHSIFLGHVMFMIMGHAPIVFGAVLGRQVTYSPVLYVPAVLLHLTLLVRIGADAHGVFEGYRWGGVLSVTVILIFIHIFAIIQGRGQAPARR